MQLLNILQLGVEFYFFCWPATSFFFADTDIAPLNKYPALLLMDLPIELDLTGTNRYYANLLMTYSALPEEQRSQFRNMIQRLECSLDGDHLEQNDTGVN